MSVIEQIRVALRLLAGVRDDRRLWRGAPLGALRDHGYEVIDSFLDRDECSRLVDSLLGREPLTSMDYQDGSWYVHRRELGNETTDLRVGQLMHAHLADEGLRRMAADRTSNGYSKNDSVSRWSLRVLRSRLMTLTPKPNVASMWID